MSNLKSFTYNVETLMKPLNNMQHPKLKYSDCQNLHTHEFTHSHIMWHTDDTNASFILPNPSNIP